MEHCAARRQPTWCDGLGITHTSSNWVLAWDEFCEEVGKQRLHGSRFAKQQPTGRKVHVIGVPRFCPVKQRIPGIEYTAKAGVIRWVELVDGVEDILSDSGRIDEEVLDELIEPCSLFRWRNAQVGNGNTETRAFVEL